MRRKNVLVITQLTVAKELLLSVKLSLIVWKTEYTDRFAFNRRIFR